MDSDRTKAELMAEVESLRRRVGELERAASLRAGQAPPAGERQFRHLAEGSVQGFYIEDDFKMLFANRAAAKLFGYDSLDDFMGIDSVLDLLAPHERTRARELNRRRRAQKEIPHHLKYEALRKDGTSFWMEIVAQVVNWEGREAVQSSLADITGRKLAEDALQESEAKYRDLVETSHDLIWRSDEAGVFTYLNPAWEETLGYAAEEMLGRSFMDFKLMPNSPQNYAVHQGLMAGRVLQNYESIYVSKSGEERTLNFNSKPLYDGAGKIVGAQGTAQDITGRIRAEEALKSNQRLLETVFDTIPIGVQVKDLSGKFMRVNPWMADIYGHSPGELIGKTFHQVGVGTPEQQQVVAEDDRKVFESGEIVDGGISALTLKNGKTIWRRRIKAPLRDESGVLIGLVGVMEDITERIEAEEALKTNQRLLETVFNTIPHSLFVRDANSVFLMVNSKLANRYGLEPEDFIGLHVTELPFATEAQRQQFLKEDQKVLRTGRQTINEEYPVVQTDGQTKIFTSSTQPLRSETGEIIGLVGVAEEITERKGAERALRESRDQLRIITDNLPVLISYVDAELRFRFINNTAENWYAQSPREVVGQLVSDVHSASSFGMFQPRFASVLAGDLVKFEETFIYPDGNKRDVDITFVPDIKETGEVRGFFALSVDITERKRAEAALRENENRLQNFIDSSPGNLSYIDREYRYRQANARYLAYVGETEDSLIGRTVTEVMGAETFELYRPWIDEALDGREQHFEISRPIGDRGVRDLEVRYIPNFDSQGQVLGFNSSVHDITERKQAEAELRLHSEIVKNMEGGVLMFRIEDETIAYTNPNFEKMFGYAPGELLQKNVSVLNAAGEKTPEEVTRKITAIVQDNGWWRGEIFNIKKDGTRFWTVAYVSEFFHSRFGRVILGVHHDITEQKQIEAQLRESQKMEAVGQLAGGIAHEFNNMLQIIISGVHFAGQHLFDPQLAKKDLDTILKSAERSASLTKQLLAYSRKTQLAAATLDLNDLTHNLIKMVQPIIGEEISLEFKPAGDLFLVKADPGMLEQALVNLCVNARDAMPGGGRITLATKNHHADREFCDAHGLRQPGGYVMISVSDDGAGMSLEIRERIFEPFFTTKEVGQGTGLGLSMVQGIIQQHEGAIEVLSEPGVGSTFNIYLPRTDSPEAKKDLPVAGKSPGGSETILVAEDEKDVLTMLVQILEDMGYVVLAARDGEEAMAVFKQNGNRIDLVILDMVMPKMRGREVYERIRGSGSDVPVLFSTGYALDSSDVEFVTGKGLHTIQKPYAPNDLYWVVRDLLDRR